ncbi:translocation protein SEC63 [Pancytospora epiphaga]|nr:translocation protein SEC63 [Pancytospora epiphaga]
MYQHDYDDSGLTTSYLLLSLMLPTALYQCYHLLMGPTVHPCRCNNCIKNRKGNSLRRMILLAASVLAASYLIHNILTIQIARRSTDFDPFTAINVREGASPAEIKKAYKKTVRKLNMKLKVAKSKDITTKAIMTANKAYKILQDPSAYEKWLSEGIEKKLIIAMPAFLIKSSVKSISIYILILGAIIPFIVYRKYSNIKYKCTTGAYYESAEQFYEKLESFSDNEELAIPQLIAFISKTKEFTTKVWKNEITDVKKVLEGVYCIPAVGNDQGYLQIMAYLCRASYSNSADAEYVRFCAVGIISAGIRIAIEEGKSKLCNALLVLRKMFIQAVPGPEYYLMQFPGITPGHIHSWRNGRPGGSGSWKECLTGKEIEEFLRKSLEGESSRNALAVLGSLPRISVKDVTAYTLNTENASSNVNEKVGSIIERDGNVYKIERGSAAYVSFKLVRKGGLKSCHVPYGQEVVGNSWIVYYQVNSEIQKSVFIFDDFEGEKEVVFALPIQDGTATLRVYSVSNGYFGVDGSDSIIIKYY